MCRLAIALLPLVPVLLLLGAALAAPPPPPVAEAFSSPAESFALALQDVLALRPAERVHTRYLSLYHMTLDEREQTIQAITLHVNHLSRTANLIPPVVVRQKNRDGRLVPVLLRVDLRHYDWDPAVWELLAPANSYYSVIRDTVEIKNGKRIKTQTTLAARWLGAKTAKALLELTNSQTPVVRADWFFVQTVVEKNRVAGYYKWLRLKNRDDYLKLTGADYKKAGAAGKEWGAVVLKSGVAQRNRQVVRYGLLDGAGWFTKDAFKTETLRRNAVNFLNGDFQHDAEEHINPLPNGLFAYLACDDKGNLQDAAPSDVGGDSTSTSNDPDIHVYLSCVRCHREGLRPINDHGRRLFSGPRRLAVREDDAKFQRFFQLYLRPLQRHLDRDRGQYADYLKEIGGPDFDSRRLAALYGSVWQHWRDEDVTLAQAAREIGTVSAQELRRALVLYSSPAPAGLGRLLPFSLLAFTDEQEPAPMTREHFEEAFDALHLVLDETAHMRGR